MTDFSNKKSGFKKVLVANRGEIALRVIRALKELGIKSVLAVSEADKDSLPAQLADEKICIGPAPASDSYLNISRIISAAIVKKCDAIHPGYGFLAESNHFAEICASYGITFIGPSPKTIALAGRKAQIIEVLKKNKIPVVPGSHRVVKEINEAKKISKEIAYPVMIKASAGGGGKGMRLVKNEQELEEAFHTAMQEAQGAFSNPDLYIEKFIESPKHIEIQIAADRFGNIIYFPERDCSIQRKHQKLLEESPSLKVCEKLRKKLGETAKKIARIIKYETVGTVEFILSKNDFYFIEVNARIQVEHPVTELVSDVDLVKLQVLLASGEKLEIKQDEIKIHAHAIECRINAEDENFMPQAGKIKHFILPRGAGVRVDTALKPGAVIPPYYDSLIAKVITAGRSRKSALKRMKIALDEFKIQGIKTNIPLHKKILENPAFLKGNYNTNFIEKLNLR
ncbi:MAG: acetyl-CoA carboxylase biotin carboxylase subunit [Elusimicrobia bacterium]|nr:acetyl-CoA carboxylase biotin carboxylase subunit [Elusimicrobiota bacterium]